MIARNKALLTRGRVFVYLILFGISRWLLYQLADCTPRLLTSQEQYLRDALRTVRPLHQKMEKPRPKPGENLYLPLASECRFCY